MKSFYTLALVSLLFGGLVGTTAVAQENPTESPTEREFSKVGVSSGTFLNLPVGARAVGMGGNFVGVADDPSAMYWNPAGIMQSEGASIGYSFGLMFAGMQHHFVGASFPVGGKFKAGVSAISYGSDDIEVTTMFEQEGTGGTYSARDLAMGVSFAGQLTDQFAFGVTGKLISLTLADQSASGVAFDVATLYDPGLLGLRIGFSVNNLSSLVRYSGTGLVQTGGVNQTTGNQNPDVELQASDATLPLIFRAGISSRVIEEGQNKLLGSVEFSTASDRSEWVGVGAEYTWNDLISARVGYTLGMDDSFGLSGGLGLNYDSGSFYGSLDYAIRPHAELGFVNVITGSVRLQ